MERFRRNTRFGGKFGGVLISAQPDALDEHHHKEKQRDAAHDQAQPGIAWFFTVRHCRYLEAAGDAFPADVSNTIT
jgi:hypothetical protein